ncbi:ATP-binding protein [Flavimaricola marinus]|uniref:ATP-binding protein n=1 Tax=Flavimaricola marinus TaxID=1819565 RepID=UPI00145504D8|nr:ATP-binding protein [Flavimaricola marinus]
MYLLANRRGNDAPDLEARDYVDRFESLQRREVIARIAGLGIPALLIWVLLSKPAPFMALIVYCTTLLITRRKLAQLKQTWSDRIYRHVILGQTLLSVLVSAVILWFLVQHEQVLMLSGAALMVGKLIHGMTATPRGSQLQRINNLLNTLTLIAIGLLQLDAEAPLVQNGMILTITIALVSYFHATALDAMSDRDKMRGVLKAGLSAKGHDAVGRLAGGFAHDFNNLLTTLLGNLDLYSNARSKTEEKAAIAAARQAAERGAQLVAQLLSVSGKARMQPDHLDLGEYLADLRLVTARLFGPEVAFHYEVQPDLPPVIADRNQLNAALIQLLINARDAMPNGGLVMLDAAIAKQPRRPSMLETGPPSGNFVRLDIYDEGTGIAAADLPRVTEPFFTTRKFGEATGLGLSVAKGFAEQSGGSLDIQSEIGKGTRVRLYLPAAEQSARDAALGKPPVSC